MLPARSVHAVVIFTSGALAEVEQRLIFKPERRNFARFVGKRDVKYRYQWDMCDVSTKNGKGDVQYRFQWNMVGVVFARSYPVRVADLIAVDIVEADIVNWAAAEQPLEDGAAGDAN